ncbi:MerR family DNA-binding transcriptional regulator [Jannaschia sp. M317]|uniref:MerR family transcriptional regulator n=1 Tax=Jannaschia sp. M317 TaxID=2867011 RepID=UPI0021A82EB0|nr:MerR family DNA-binding transcriptional regulator [Jannaschia sp. M317]UWQ16509.1 MerR family DNA-binding transcriptional regulator [Jannaschia sp. M317]
MPDKLTFKEMCARFDVTPRTLRHYEYIELLFPERDGRSRFYHPREVARMTLIMRGRKFGFSLEEIRQWLELYDADPEGRMQMEAWIKLADGQLEELAERQRHLEAAIAELSVLRDKVKADLKGAS